jgi:hypothetical protein
MTTQKRIKQHLAGARITNFVGTRLFLYGLLAVFFLQSAWIAISNKFPLAFDESLHYGVIKLYANQWSPFFSAQPEGGNPFGALTRDPSYLFHYLMSFPYRAFHAIWPSLEANVLFLRFIDIALFIVGIIIFRKLLLAVKLSSLQANILLLFVVFLPMAPFIAANINYDNLMIPLVALALLMTVRLYYRLQNGEAIKWTHVLGLFSLCCFASLVKFSFLPIFAGIGLSLLAAAFWYRRTLRFDAGRLLSRVGLVVIGLTIIGGGLFAERYAFNMVAYHAPNPDCGQVMSTSACMEYGIYARSVQLSAAPHPAASWARFKQFNHVWVSLLTSGMFSVVDADHNGIVLPPARFIVAVTLGVVFAGVCFAVYYRRSLGQYAAALVLLLVIAGCYLAALWLQTYQYFNSLGIPIAIQARYLMPILPVLAIVPVLGISAAFKKRPHMHLAWAVPMTVMLLIAGGVSTYVLRSNQEWYRNDGVIATVNHAYRAVLEPLVK